MASMMMMIIILIMHNLNRWSPVSLNTIMVFLNTGQPVATTATAATATTCTLEKLSGRAQRTAS